MAGRREVEVVCFLAQPNLIWVDMPAPRRSATARSAPAQPGLRLHSEGDRYSTLLKERERLLRGISTKKQKLERALIESREARAAVLEQLQPFLDRYEAATAQLRALFEQLLAPGRLSAHAAKQVAKVRQSLVVLGFLGQLDDEEPDDFESWDAASSREGPRQSARDGGFGDEAPESSEPHSKREVSSAGQRGQGKDQQSLRVVFRRLVAAAHPDRASNESEREHRTAILKQATQAYEAGDLARLLELENAWRGQSLPTQESAEASCRELERVIRELRAQAGQLQRELRAAKQSGTLTPFDEPILEALDEAQADVEQLEALCNFVTRYRDGEMSLSEFVRGPLETADAEEEAEAVEAFLADVLGERGSGRSKARKPGRAKPKPASKTKQRRSKPR